MPSESEGIMGKCEAGREEVHSVAVLAGFMVVVIG